MHRPARRTARQPGWLHIRVLLIVTVLAALWLLFTGAEQYRWYRFKQMHNCTLFNRVETRVEKFQVPVVREDGSIGSKMDTARFLGYERWECDGPEDEPDSYVRWLQ